MSMFGRKNRSGRSTDASANAGKQGAVKRGFKAAARLHARAGRMEHVQPEHFGIEPLEKRQLMFALTVTNVDPATGLGTATADFGYVIPYLTKVVPAGMPDDTFIEEFEDEMAAWTTVQQQPPPVPNNTVFDDSQIRMTFSAVSSAPVLWVLGPDGMMLMDRDLQIRLTTSDFVEFLLQEGMPPNPLIPRVANAVRLTLTGLDLNPVTGTKIQLLRDGDVVDTYSPAELQGLGGATGQFTLVDRGGFGFTSFRFSSFQQAPDNNSYFDQFVLDDVFASFPSGRFGSFNEERIFGVRATIVGPLGATANFFDLYDRSIRQTLALGVPPMSMVALVDRNDNGVPDFNDGIGRITLTGFGAASATEASSSAGMLTMFGGEIDFAMNAFTFTLLDNVDGFADDFEQAGFGYGLTNATPPAVIGLPPIAGSIIIGSPFVRNNTNAGTYLNNAGAINFNRPNQGVFAPENSTVMSSIMIHGIVHGSSQINGAAGRFAVALLSGSLNVRGDLGTLAVGGDCGAWTRDDQNGIIVTNSVIQVGRTLGEALVGGRMVSGLIVSADVNNTALAILPTFNYFEKEVIYGIPLNAMVPAVIQTTLNATSRETQGIPFGTGLMRNDTIAGAEYIGVNASGIRLRGTLALADPVSMGEDPSDVYAFAADGTTDVVVSLSFDDRGQSRNQAYFRIVDAAGRVLAASRHVSQLSDDRRRGDAELSGPTTGDRVVFRPDHADVYYLVVSTPNTTPQSPLMALTYDGVITGLAPVTFGALRTGAGLGSDNPGGANVISLSSGAVGSIRVGVGFIDGGGGEGDPLAVTNATEDVDDALNYRFSSFSTSGTVYNITTGSDVNGAQILIGGNLGSFITGISPTVGGGPNEGDVNTLTLTVGGTVGVINISGAAAWDNDPMPPAPRGIITIRTGANGGPGNIGQILIGDRLVGSAFNLTTSDRSTIDQFIVGTNGGPGSILGERAPRINMGIGSDIRFFSIGGNIESGSNPNAFTTLIPNQTIQIVDDGGATIFIRISGGVQGSVSFGQIRFVPIDSAQGVSIARIDATLNGGANLEITGLTAGVASIGLINITTDGAGSSVVVASSITEIDIGNIIVDGGTLTNLRNVSPGGDIVSADLTGVTNIFVLGNLGNTQTNGAGPALLGTFLGLQSGLSNDTRSPLGINTASINGNWNGQIFIPVNAATATVGMDETLEDLGGPFDGYLNGVVVRTGNVASVVVYGSIGDVILQGGNLGSMIANADGMTVQGRFDGIVGSVYANDIGSIDVGDGVAGPGPSPFAAAGIFADDDITSVFGARGLNPVIRGVILAADRTPAGPPNSNGLVSLNVINGRYDGAFIGASVFDEFWSSARFTREDGQGDDLGETDRRDVVSINASNSLFYRTRVVAANIASITIQGSAFDASTVDATGNVGVIFATEFRNSTLLGQPLEFRSNSIFISGNLTSILTYNYGGDISDLTVSVRGTLLSQIGARNLTRDNINIANNAQQIFAANDVRSSSFITGHLLSFNVTGDIRSSSIIASGPIDVLTAGQNITSSTITSAGPGGGIGYLSARFFITGTISAAGPIGTIISTEGDIIASIRTTETNGTLSTLSAGRDLVVSVDVSGDVQLITAGRNIGQLGEQRGTRLINIRGNLNSITTPNGQIYTDLRIGQSITGVVRVGRVVALPGNDLVSTANITAYGRIALVDIQGDLNGNITSESGGIGTVMVTNGSFRPNKTIRANDGSIDAVLIRGGHLLGNIIAEEAINDVQVFAGADGFAGDIGVNPNLSQFAFFDARRNQLPPDVQPLPTFQGPRIQAGTNIVRVEVEGGSMWETGIYAGNSVLRVFVWGTILNDNVTGGIGGNFIAAGDSVVSVEALHFVGGAIIAAGITDLGADNRPGGNGANTDTVQFGRVGDLFFRGGTGAVTVAAGMNTGPNINSVPLGGDGIYNTADDSVANGISSIGSVNVTGAALETTAFADNGIGVTSPGIVRGGPGLHQFEPQKVIEFVPASGLVPAGGLVFTTTVGETGLITLTGPGQAYFQQVFDSGLGRNVNRLALINTTLASRLIVDTNQNSLTDFRVVSNDGSSIGLASIRGNMFGDSSFYYDGYVQVVEFGGLNMTGSIGAGNDIGSLTVGPVTRGFVDANHIQSIIVGGDFGSRTVTGEAAIRLLSGGSISIGAGDFGLISVKRDIASINVVQDIDRASIRAGRSIGSITTRSILESRISARNNITSVTASANMTSSLIYAGTDLGADGSFGGLGASADVITNGTITSIVILGNFSQSDIAAGVARGPDGFLGTADDIIDEGHSSIGTINIIGQATGSLLNSQSFRIISNGSIAQVLARNQVFTGSGNLLVQRFRATADALRVTDMRVTESSRLYSERIMFNQPINRSTLSAAIGVFEVRGGGTQTIRLAEGVDYNLSYETNTNTAVVVFSRDITERSLPQLNGVPGPGVYRFTIDPAVIRGETQNARLDGNGNGILEGDADLFSGDDIVGDAGDKRDVNTGDANTVGVAVTVGNPIIGFHTVDMLYASDLNLVLDNNYSPDGLPDPNHVVTIRGIIGDHPDQDINFFGPTNDVDLYRFTLRAGQVLRLGDMLGVAQLADRQLLDANGNIVNAISATAQPAPTNPVDITQTANLTGEQQYLITTTGTYYLAVAALVLPVIINNEGLVPNFPTTAGSIGSYNFTINIFDDGDTGFNGDTDSSNGVGVVNAPVPTAFRGLDNAFNTPDDLATIVIGSYVFTLGTGSDGVRGTFDDLVSGSNGSGITTQRTSGPDGVFGNSDDRLITFADASIGESNFTGVPSLVTTDADVYHLNNGEFITPGTRIRVTLRLTELGSNIGLFGDTRVRDLRGTAQLAIFDTTNSTGVSDATLLAAPSDFRPIGGPANRVTSDGNMSYGYDANGDFFIEFIAPVHAGGPGGAGKYAVYVQGSIRSDYTLEIVTQGTGTLVSTPRTQNILLETNGGIVNWLEASGAPSILSSFRASSVGFTGLIGSQTVDSYILNNLITNLQDLFNAAGVDVRISSDPSAFEGEDFSTVFLTSSNEPAFLFANETFGVSQHTDAFNIDHNDQAVIFLPSLGLLGLTPARSDVDRFVSSLTSATTRRIGELVGLRTVVGADGRDNVPASNPYVANATDPMNANSVRIRPTTGIYRFSNINRALSPAGVGAGLGGGLRGGNTGDVLFDTDFFLGQENTLGLIRRIFNGQ